MEIQRLTRNAISILLFVCVIFNIVEAKEIFRDYGVGEIDAGIKKINGDTTEYVMHKLFKQNGWKQIQGEVGPNGIDGLYIKKNTSGIITNVMFGEAKYNNATLGNSLCGKQMSKNCLNTQIDNLIKTYPNDKHYTHVKEFLNNGNYRARIFQLKIDNNFLMPEIKSINHDGDFDTQKLELIGNEKYKINNMRIDINNPQNSFETQFVENFRRGQKIGLMGKFNLSALEAEMIVKNNNVLKASDIEKTVSTKTYIRNTVSRSYKSILDVNINNKPPLYFQEKVRSFWKAKYTKILLKKII